MLLEPNGCRASTFDSLILVLNKKGPLVRKVGGPVPSAGDYADPCRPQQGASCVQVHGFRSKNLFGPSPKKTSRRPERRTGTRVQTRNPSPRLNDEEHNGEHEKDDDIVATNNFKVSSKKIRGVQMSA